MTATEANCLTKRLRRNRLGSRSAARVQSTEVRTDPFRGRPLARIFHNLEIPEYETVAECARRQMEYKKEHCRERARRRYNDKTPLLLKDRLNVAAFVFLIVEMFSLLACGALLTITVFAWMTLAVIVIAWFVPAWINKLNNKLRRDQQEEAFHIYMYNTHWDTTPLKDFKRPVPEEARRKAAMIEGEAKGKAAIEVRHFYEDPYIMARHLISKEVMYFHYWEY